MEKDTSIKTLIDRLRILTEEREATKRILDSAVNSLAFSAMVDESFSPENLLAQAAQKLRTFINIDALVFYLFSPDGLDYTPVFFDPPQTLSFFEEEMLPLVEDGTFAWAVDRNKPVVITASVREGATGASEREAHLLLHSLTTANRTIGMFMGLLGEDESKILDISFAFFTVILSSVASILQNADLYSMIRSLNTELSGKIASLKESERNLASAMKTREVFLANVSHEVRTPLNAIIGITTLLNETSLDSRQSEMLRILKDESASLLRLINDLLDFSKMEAGKLDFEDLPFDLHELWESVRKSFLPRVDEKIVVFRMFLDESVPHLVSGDAFRIRQVLGNLVSNAIKFTPRGGVFVHGKCLERRMEHFLLSVEVRDTGIGISPRKMERLFEPFMQGDASTTRQFGGTGLGLAISKRIIEAMGGSIAFESSEGEGSLFLFSLPLREFHAIGEEENAAVIDESEAFPLAASVLVVEDNATNRNVAVSLLKLLGLHDIETAENGTEAIEKLSARRYDLVLMDIQMPFMDGLQTVAVIRDPSSTVLDHETPVAAMTANVLPGDRDRYFSAGMSDYIAKPVLPAELRKLLSRLLGETASLTAEKLREPAKEPLNDLEVGIVFRPRLLMERMEGDITLCQQTIGLFVEDSDQMLKSIKAMIQDRDSSECRRMIHALRGASANVEAIEMMLLSDAAEQAAERGDLDEVERALPELRRARERFLEEARSLGEAFRYGGGKEHSAEEERGGFV